ncbi:hypothetical protein Y032_0051g2165 [Ancylostoma ceylanicum]|uniref:Uncharacterized protein n=1 Tax=Ancylostoma ceylanicum TaxID=53326 RepID=A0A016U9S3_9BILA|nr:hypothetical protein Y032_0051g2165 [Ancylostoma ceylanicum]
MFITLPPTYQSGQQVILKVLRLTNKPIIFSVIKISKKLSRKISTALEVGSVLFDDAYGRARGMRMVACASLL